jgi:DNA repair exonuclease SbcCD ATPase subunit
VEGVRDLELDALAPSIADVATKLLQSSGREGHIEIDTTRMSSGSAKKAKQIEDFLIFHVGQDGERQDIATCSGGEMVWIRKALYDGFAIIRARNAGIRFMTAFLDETDGALFPKDRQDYYRMLEAAHRESGRYQTILTTHSPEIQAMAAQTIDVTKLEARGAAGKESAA